MLFRLHHTLLIALPSPPLASPASAPFLPSIQWLGAVPSLDLHGHAWLMAAIVANAVVEALTDQIDNLVLPLITFALLTHQ